MLNAAAQVLVVTRINLRSSLQRPGNCLVIVIGITAVVAVLISILAMSSGFTRAAQGGSRHDRVLVLSSHADGESASAMTRSNVAVIVAAAEVTDDSSDASAVSAEVVLVAPVSRKNNGADAYITLRGVGSQLLRVRPEIHLVAGRMVKPGLHELMVGGAAQQQFANLEIGQRIRLNDGDWTIVGVFTGGDTVRDSEVIADAQTVMSAYKLDSFNSVTALLTSGQSLESFRAALKADPSLDVKVLTEPEYLSIVSRPTQKLLRAVTLLVGGLMTVGALFGALNTMYSSVASRARELATFRALGFGSGVMLTSILLEALLLALLGATAGVAIAYAAFDGTAISTLGGSRWDAQIVYSLTITPSLVAIAVALACGIGAVGGFAAAAKALRGPVFERLGAA
jgi:putative ABC transport system permease protein